MSVDEHDQESSIIVRINKGERLTTSQLLSEGVKRPAAPIQKIRDKWKAKPDDPSALVGSGRPDDPYRLAHVAPDEPLPCPLFEQQGWVYFIEAEGLNRIKIGWSRDADDRLATLATGSPVPLRIVARFPGSRGDEQRLHRRFAAHLVGDGVREEWFTFASDIRAFLAGGAQ